jgi:hypothetical protein
LDQTEARDFGDLVLRAVSRQALDESALNQVTISFENHIDEVNNNDSA